LAASAFKNNVLSFYIAQITQVLSEFLNPRGNGIGPWNAYRPVEKR
jgi:hypothetical protein